MSLINENIEQMKLLINYNPKLTLTENRNVILEGGELGKLLQTMGKDSKALLRAELEGLESVSKLVGDSKKFKTTDDLLLSIQAGKTNANDILKDVLKNPSKFANKFPEIYKSASSNYAHQLMNSKSELAIKFQNATPMDRKALLRDSGYSKQAIENITQEVRAIEKSKLKSSLVNKGVKDSSKVSEEIASATGKSEKEIQQIIKQDTFFSKNKEYFTKLYNNIKSKGISKETLARWKQKGFINKLGKIPWKKVVLWAAAIGVSYYLLKTLLEKGRVFVDDTDTGGGGTGGSGGGNTGGSTSYTTCNDFPYKKGCSSSVVSEVQKCLGLGADGKFGSKTEAKLKELGYGTEITQDVYNKIKEKCGTSDGTTTTTTVPAPEFQDVDVIPSQMTW